MKNLKIIFTACLIAIVGSCSKDAETIQATQIPCLPKSLSNNVLAFYPFSKGTLNDISGNKHHLINTTTAKPTQDRNANDSCAYEFDNIPVSSEYLTNSATDFLNGLTEFSVSLWYQPQDTSISSQQFQSLVSSDMGNNCPDKNGQWSIALYDCRKALFFKTSSVWDKHTPGFSCEQEISSRTNVWHHLVATYNQSGLVMKIYKNGILQDTASGNGNCGSVVTNNHKIGDLVLGKDYTGKIDDVIIFNKTLTQAEVTMLYKLETCCEK